MAGLDGLKVLLGRARLVVAAVEVTTPVVTRDHLVGVDHEILVVDLGLPRAVASDVPGC